MLTKQVNEGKAMALNDALPLLPGELVLIVDADGRPQPDALRWMVPHFVKVPRVAAVTGNPRVVNTSTLLAKLQAIEFTATVSVLRRAQATWGRLMTFSGICTALRRSAIEDVGRFRVGMATEDIALAWQLQTTHADVRYEPRALFAMQVPETLPAWWSQRTRWARGLAQVLRQNAGVMRSLRTRRMSVAPVLPRGRLLDARPRDRRLRLAGAAPSGRVAFRACATSRSATRRSASASC